MNTTLLERIIEISRKMAETRNIDQLLNMAMQEVIEIVGAESGYLVLVGPNGELQFRVRYEKRKDDILEHVDELSHTIFDDVIKSGKPRIIVDALSDSRYEDSISVINLQIRSVMCVPLIARGNTLGAIYVENRKITAAFQRDDLEPFTFFANQAAVSIENTMLINNLEALVAERTSEVEHSWREAVEANKLRTTLLGQLTHDMRTPVSVVKLSLSNLSNPRGGELNEQQSEWVNRATHANNHMSSLIQNVFDLSKLELGTMELACEQVSLKLFLERVFQIGMALPWADSVQFICDLPDTLPDVLIDPIRIQQVLLNLLGNALKFTTTGQVTIHATSESDNVHIGVRDTGEGISEDCLERVFDRFQQFDTDPNRRRQGAGLGLAICRELVENHGGHIWVASTLGQGSDFIFTLPQ
jgi:signal transduction histidine kinase